MGYQCESAEWDYKVQWLVNGVDVVLYQAQFEITNTYHTSTYTLTSQLWIKNPVALRGPTEITCKAAGIYVTWEMNSKILVNIIKC